MNLNEYQTLAKRTNADLGDDKLNLSHMVLGMCSEIPELKDAYDNNDPVNIGEEIADIYWYVANYETLRDYKSDDYERNTSGELGIQKLSYDIGLLQDLVKKNIAYGKEIDEVEEKRILASLKDTLYNTFISNKLNQSEYLQKNIDKLKARFPEKFTKEKALNRDFYAERKILES